MAINSLYIGITKLHGRGVFAARGFKKGEILEKCPILFMPLCEADLTLMAEYVFLFKDTPSIALGYGSLYNHSINPNVAYDFDNHANMVVMRAARDIKRGEQLFIDYGLQS